MGVKVRPLALGDLVLRKVVGTTKSVVTINVCVCVCVCVREGERERVGNRWMMWLLI